MWTRVNSVLISYAYHQCTLISLYGHSLAHVDTQ